MPKGVIQYRMIPTPIAGPTYPLMLSCEDIGMEVTIGWLLVFENTAYGTTVQL